MSLLYDSVKVPVYLGQLGYFRKVHVLNAHRVPIDKPVMLLPNHPNAFLDAVLVCIQLPQQVNFLVRSDVFNSPVKKYLLNKLNNYPIYRIQEGAENLKKNEETFRVCNELFRQNKTILIFPEGICIREKRVRRLKKGAARIAFGSEEQSDFNLDLKLVPVGVNYSRFGSMGGEMIMNFGEPISILKYKELYKNEKARAVNELTNDIEERLRALVVDVPAPEEDELFNHVQDIVTERKETGTQKFKRRKAFADKIASLKTKAPETLNVLKEKAAIYNTSLVKYGVNDKIVAGFTKWNMMNELLLLMTAPFFLLAWVLNVLPYRWAYALSNKVVGKEEFFDSVNMIGGTFIFILYYIFLALASRFFLTGYQAILFLFILPFTGYFALRWWRRSKKKAGVKKFKALTSGQQQELKSQREEVLSILTGSK